jgi:TolB-like protein
MQILEILVSSPKQLVTREQLRQALWPDGTFVAFDDVLNQNIRRLRQALEDDADEPRFIETLPRRGYRFIAAVEDGVPPCNQQVEMPRLAKAETWGMPLRLRLALLGTAVVVVGVWALWKTAPRTPNAPKVLRSIAVLPLENLSGDPSQEYFADGMTDALITSLAKLNSIRVISRTSIMQYKGARKSLPQIARELNVDAVVEGTVVRSGQNVRITAQLIQAATGRELPAEF